MEAVIMNSTFTLPRSVPGQTRTPPFNGEQAGHSPMNLWGMLADLGNELIQKHGFSPADLQGCSTYVNRTTEPLVRFLVWLQHTPEAASVLRDMGVWQEDIGESAEVQLNRGEQLSPTLARPRWPRKKRNSVA
jgi:hypothetical protein